MVRRAPLRYTTLPTLVPPWVRNDGKRHAMAIGAGAGHLRSRPALASLAPGSEFPRLSLQSSAEPPGPADRHVLEERAHPRVGVDPEGIHENSARAARRLDRIGDAHVVGIRDPLEALVLPDRHLARPVAAPAREGAQRVAA